MPRPVVLHVIASWLHKSSTHHDGLQVYLPGKVHSRWRSSGHTKAPRMHGAAQAPCSPDVRVVAVGAAGVCEDLTLALWERIPLREVGMFQSCRGCYLAHITYSLGRVGREASCCATGRAGGPAPPRQAVAGACSPAVASCATNGEMAKFLTRYGLHKSAMDDTHHAEWHTSCVG